MTVSPTVFSQTGDNITGDNLSVSLTAHPNQAGSNLITINVLGSDGAPLDDISRVTARFTYTGQEIGTLSANADPIAAGD